MTSMVVLLRGINVGGNNKVPMADLEKCLGSPVTMRNLNTVHAIGTMLSQP
jgi:uncharacterized protein (DUF1697 family)